MIAALPTNAPALMLYLVYTTFPSHAEADSLARSLLQQKLVACVNILAPHTALYKWEGKLESQQEWGILCKTTETQRDATMRYIESHHPYKCPAVLAWPATHVNAAYQAWATTSILPA